MTKKKQRVGEKNGFPDAFVLTSGISFIFTEPLTYIKMDNASPLPPLYKNKGPLTLVTSFRVRICPVVTVELW